MLELRLKPGREKSLKNRHPWLFSGAFESIPRAEPGTTAVVTTGDGRRMAVGAFSPASQIAIRVWSFDAGDTIDADFFRRRVQAALERRTRWPETAGAGALRLINAEADGLPGVIVDRYADYLCCQFLSAGAEFWRDAIVTALEESCRPAGIWERSDVEVRAREQLPPRAGLLRGVEPPPEVEISLHGLRFLADLRHGHKTGFYLDQSANLALAREVAHGRELLNCFAYSGSFTVAALAGGASAAVNIDSSAPALALAARQLALNGLPEQAVEQRCADVFEELRRLRDARRAFDLVVLDPPKFVANAAQLERGSRAYKDINLLGLKLLRPGGLLLSCSCSGHVGAELFQKIVADAALDAGREARIIRYLGPGADHPVLTSFPEGRYLKGLLCAVE